MRKQDLLNIIDRALIDKLYGYCYRRCRDSAEAEDLCSEIVLSLIEAAGREGEVESPAAFIWKIAHNVYADYAEKRSRQSVRLARGEDLDSLPDFSFAPDRAVDDREEEAWQLRRIWREVAFLSKAYREVMILYYLEEKSVSDVALLLGITANTVRQRLFAARNIVKKEVLNMSTRHPAPVSLLPMDWDVWGNGHPLWGDPRDVCTRQLSRHIVWLCRQKAKTVKEISDALNIPMPYAEEELDIQCRGANGLYGFLQRREDGKYIANCILLDKEEIREAQAIYQSRIPEIVRTVQSYLEEHKAVYLQFPYLNRRIDWNLVLWGQIVTISRILQDLVSDILRKQYFPNEAVPDRPFSVYGYQRGDAPLYGAGWDGASAEHVCGVSYVGLENIYFSRIQAHFHCGLNIASDPQIQLAIRAVHGLPLSELNGIEKEHAAKAVACGYLFKEGETLYTKFLVMRRADRDSLFEISYGLKDALRDEAEKTAGEMADFIRRAVPRHLIGEYLFVNALAAQPVINGLTDHLISDGLLIPPPNGVGAEGIWMSVE